MKMLESGHYFNLKGMTILNEIPLSEEHKKANIFIREMTNSKASTAYVNPDYFKGIYELLRPMNDYEDGCMLGGVEIRFKDSIKKYYFTK